MPFHSHPFWEIIVVMAGSEAVVMDGQRYVASSGDVLIYPKTVAHEEEHVGPVALESYFISFEWRQAHWDVPPLIQDRDGRIRELIVWLWEEQQAFSPWAEHYRATLLECLLAECERISSCREETGLVSDVRAYIRDHLDETVTLDQLARFCGMSKYHFVRRYKQLSGMTPMHDVRRIRLERARHLLLTTNAPLKTIAALVGFSDEFYLSRSLSKHFGTGARRMRDGEYQGRQNVSVRDPAS